MMVGVSNVSSQYVYGATLSTAEFQLSISGLYEYLRLAISGALPLQYSLGDIYPSLPPVVTGISHNTIYVGQKGISLTGTVFSLADSHLWLADSNDFATAYKVEQNITSQTDTSALFDVVQGVLESGFTYLFWVNRWGEVSPAFPLYFSTDSPSFYEVSQEGDVYMYDGSDGGDIQLDDGFVVMTKYLETSVYLCLFGGNFNDDSSQSTYNKQWWGNFGESSELSYRGRLQSLLIGRPLTSASIAPIEEAAAADIIDGLSSVLSSVDVSASLSLKRVDLMIAMWLKDGTQYKMNVGVSI
jgi:hypothetical protein